MVFHFGSSRVPNSIVSVTSRIDGSGGKRNSFCATNSLRMSFCVVPSSCARGKPRFSAAAMYIAQIGAAGELIVIDVEMRSSGMPVEQDLHVGQRADGHAARAELTFRLGIVRVVAVQRGHVVGDREAGLAGAQELVEALVGVLGRAEAGEHAHRPQARPVAGGVDAARERRLARVADVAQRIEVRPGAVARPQAVAEVVDRRRTAAASAGALQVERRVKPVDLHVADRAEARSPLVEQRAFAALERLLAPGVVALCQSSLTKQCLLHGRACGPPPRCSTLALVRRRSVARTHGIFVWLAGTEARWQWPVRLA